MVSFSTRYYTPSHPSALGGVRRLTLERVNGEKVKANNARKWLSSQEAYTVHKSIRRKFPRRQTIVSGPGEQMQTDLVDVKKYRNQNDGILYLLTAIDVFSKRAWVVPIQAKTGINVRAALKKILDSTYFRTCQSDKGKEYLNHHVQSLFSENGVTHFTSQNETIKASIVERFNRTLQESMHRWMTYASTHRYIDLLPDLVEAYNNRYHKSIGMAPNKVCKENQEDIWLRLYPPTLERKKPKLDIDDYVRISKLRLPFAKGYTPSWSVEVYKVTNVKRTTPTVYEIEDLNGEEIVGTFYESELQKITKPDTYKIEKILKRKRVRGKNSYFVKWIGYPESFNQWITESDIV